MLAALLGCAVAVLAASAPGVALSVRDLSHDQGRADTARLNTRAGMLAHALADERDDLAALAARGPATAGGAGLPAADRARVDRQTPGVAAGAPAELRTALAALPGIRRTALTGKGGPQAVINGYQPLIDALGRLGGQASAPLSRAVGAAAVQRGLLVSALTAGGGQRALVAAAQTAQVQEQAALAEFRATAGADPRRQYDQTVTGPDAAQADRYLAELLGQPQLTPADAALGAAKVNSVLTARISLMRSVDASLATREAKAAAAERDHAVTMLELRCALALLCLLVLVGVLITVFRSLTRPLAALHRWSRTDVESGQGVEVIGAGEFATVAGRANALTQEAQALRARGAELVAERAASLEAQSALTAERDTLLRARGELNGRIAELTGRISALDGRLAKATAQTAAQHTHVNLSLRTLGLVERQLTVIEGMEEHEQDPDRLGSLFKLDHLATRIRRNSENLLVLTGTEHSHGATARPVSLVDVARAAISEAEGYERVRIRLLPGSWVAGRASDDISHLIAELLDNAAAFSTPPSEILLSGWLLESGEVMLSVEDSGIGVPPERLGEINARLADPDPAPPGSAAGIGLYVAARLAHRHGVRVELRPQQPGGTAAVVMLPRLLVPELPPGEPPATPVEAALTGGGVSLTAALTPPQPLMALTPPERPAPPKPEPPAAAPTPQAPAAAVPEPAPARSVVDGLTAKGLPQRVRRGGPAERASVREPLRGAPVDAEELRRKLGGMQRGLTAGRRDSEIEISTGTGPMAGVTPARGTAVPAQHRPGPGSHRRPAPAPQAGPGTPAGHDGPHDQNEARKEHHQQDIQGDAGAADTVEEATR